MLDMENLQCMLGEMFTQFDSTLGMKTVSCLFYIQPI